ncbi:ABC transporter permease [Clostridium sp. BJN0001]|uniref:ABC transporter permease n=1 Tax=Clostridium sp. BJN0001 TaxID=2930219 RepID=UPI001FCFC1A8|nr:ABC transporter permease [Clostridium sp. BJN0001]
MKSYSTLSIRYLKENKKKSILTILGITMASILISAVFTFALSFVDSMISYERSIKNWEFSLNSITKTNAINVKNNVEIKDVSIQGKTENLFLGSENKKTNLTKSGGEYYNNIYRNKIISGKYPSKENEVVLDKVTADKMSVDVGDEIKLKDNDGNILAYSISGLTEFDKVSANENITLYGFLDYDNLPEDSSYKVYVNLKSKKNKQDIIKNVIEDSKIEITEGTKTDNSELLYLTGNGGSDDITASMKKVAAFFIIIIMVCTITVIYNSFNISVLERMRYFGVLKAIGATKRQIKNLILKEGFIMGIIAIPLGYIIGFLALKIGMSIIASEKFMFIFDDFKVGFYPIVIVFDAFLIFITIYISLLMPIIKANRVSIIEAIKNVGEIKIGKIKHRKNRIINSLFGVEGSIAYKNIRRTPFRFIVTILALTVSIILFNVFYGFIDFSKQTISQQYMNVQFDSCAQKWNYPESFTDDEIAEIKSQPFIRTVYSIYSNYLNEPIENKFVSDNNNNQINEYEDIGYGVLRTNISVYDSEKEIDILKKYINLSNKDIEKLNDGGVILVDGYPKKDSSSGKKYIRRQTTFNVSDVITLPKTNVNDKDKIKNDIVSNNVYNSEVVGIINYSPLTGTMMNGQIELIYTKQGYEKVNSKVQINKLAFKFDGAEEAREECFKYFDEIKDSKGYFYEDFTNVIKDTQTIFNQVEFFVYCFIIIVTIISIINIFNTISTGIITRKREFSVLKAVGMTEKQLRKSIMFEGNFYGVISAILGGISSALLLLLLINLGGGIAAINYHFNFIAFTISIVSAVVITYISTAISLRKLKKITIVQGIRDEN